jgi:hypothetical protein
MLLERRHPRRGIGRIAGENLVTAHDPVFHLVDGERQQLQVVMITSPVDSASPIRFIRW